MLVARALFCLLSVLVGACALTKTEDKRDALAKTIEKCLPKHDLSLIQFGQDVDEDWPLEVIGHDGKSRNVTIKPGEIIYYESHSVIHGRPYPLKGRHFANIFLHYQPYHPYNVRGDSAKDETGKNSVLKKVQVNTKQASSSNERGPQAARSFAALGHLEPLTKVGRSSTSQPQFKPDILRF